MDIIFCYLKGCTRCRGDLVFDEGDWRCWQCGHYFYTNGSVRNEPSLSQPTEGCPPPRPEDCFSAHSLESTPEEENGFKGQRKPYGARSSRNINSVIRAKQTSDERWWARNREIVGYLDHGKSVREISRLVGLGERQVRVARERLADLRSNEEVQTRKKEDRADWS